MFDENFVQESLHLQAVLRDKSDENFVRRKIMFGQNNGRLCSKLTLI